MVIKGHASMSRRPWVMPHGPLVWGPMSEPHRFGASSVGLPKHDPLQARVVT